MWMVVRFAEWQSHGDSMLVLPLLGSFTHWKNKGSKREKAQLPVPMGGPALLGFLGNFPPFLPTQVLLACPGGYHMPNCMSDGQVAVPKNWQSSTLPFNTLTLTDAGRSSPKLSVLVGLTNTSGDRRQDKGYILQY